MCKFKRSSTLLQRKAVCTVWKWQFMVCYGDTYDRWVTCISIYESQTKVPKKPQKTSEITINQEKNTCLLWKVQSQHLLGIMG